MTCHDCDPRYAEPECRARVAALYLPLLGIIMDVLPQLHGYQMETRGKGTDSLSGRKSQNQSLPF